jgi:hypothetical protein
MFSSGKNSGHLSCGQRNVSRRAKALRTPHSCRRDHVRRPPRVQGLCSHSSLGFQHFLVLSLTRQRVSGVSAIVQKRRTDEATATPSPSAIGPSSRRENAGDCHDRRFGQAPFRARKALRWAPAACSGHLAGGRSDQRHAEHCGGRQEPDRHLRVPEPRVSSGKSPNAPCSPSARDAHLEEGRGRGASRFAGGCDASLVRRSKPPT